MVLMLRAVNDVSELLGLDEQYEPFSNNRVNTRPYSDADFDAEIRA